MVPGSSTESLALDVALQCGVPLPVVQRAAELWKVGGAASPGSLCAPQSRSGILRCPPVIQQAAELLKVGLTGTLLGLRPAWYKYVKSFVCGP